MAEGETDATRFAIDGLGRRPVRRTRGGVTGVTNRDVTTQRMERLLIKDRGDESVVLKDRDGLVIPARNSGRLLSAVLERDEGVKN